MVEGTQEGLGVVSVAQLRAGQGWFKLPALRLAHQRECTVCDIYIYLPHDDATSSRLCPVPLRVCCVTFHLNR